MNKKIRLLNADEIECRPGTVGERGLSLLLYKDARADMKILDETYGPLNWKRTHVLVGDNLYCCVDIYDKFRVKEIEYNDKREIIGLTIINQDGVVVYCLKSQKNEIVVSGEEFKAPALSSEQINDMKKELKRTGIALDTVLKRYNLESSEMITVPIFNSAMNGLKKTKQKAA